MDNVRVQRVCESAVVRVWDLSERPLWCVEKSESIEGRESVRDINELEEWEAHHGVRNAEHWSSLDLHPRRLLTWSLFKKGRE